MLFRISTALFLCVILFACNEQPAEEQKIKELVEQEKIKIQPFPSTVDSTLATGEFRTKEEDSLLIYSTPKGVPVKKCTRFHILTGNSKYEMPLGIWSTRTWLGGGEYVDTTNSIITNFKTADKITWYYPNGKIKFTTDDIDGKKLMVIYDDLDSIVREVPFEEFDKAGNPFVKNLNEARGERNTFEYYSKTRMVKKKQYYADGSGPAHITYELDKQNRVVKKISNFGDKDYIDEYKWRSDGQPESYKIGARFIDFIYDKKGRLVKQKESGVYTDYYYNSKGKLKAFIEHSGSLGTTGINMLQYTYLVPIDK